MNSHIYFCTQTHQFVSNIMCILIMDTLVAHLIPANHLKCFPEHWGQFSWIFKSFPGLLAQLWRLALDSFFISTMYYAMLVFAFFFYISTPSRSHAGVRAWLLDVAQDTHWLKLLFVVSSS